MPWTNLFAFQSQNFYILQIIYLILIIPIYIIILIKVIQMSARRVIRQNAQYRKKMKQLQQLKQSKIFTFNDKEQRQNLEYPSQNINAFHSQTLIQQALKLQKVAAFKKIGYLTNCQWQIPVSMFVINRNLKDKMCHHQQYNNFNDFQIYVNPIIDKYNTEKRPCTQQCLSFPFFEGIVDRSNQILASYFSIKQNDEKKQVQRKKVVLQGFTAQMYQHCMDHLQGKHFLDPQITKGRLKIKDMEHLFQDCNFLLRQYNLRVKDALEKGTEKSQNFLKIREDYISRICSAFKKESQKARIQTENRMNKADMQKIKNLFDI